MRAGFVKRRAFLMGLTVCMALAGCETIGYYSQAVKGQLTLLQKRQSIQEVLQSQAVDDTTRDRLQRVLEFKRFAREQLLLPGNGSFDSYVKLSGEYPVWSVVATPEFSLEPKTWCYPVVGCAAYRGYFSKADAQCKAAHLQEQGFDVTVGGVPAYSTLGWFSDPVLSSYLYWPDVSLAAVIFHELAHQKFYLPGDSALNESFASAVERAGVKRWLVSRNQLDALQSYEQRLAHEELFFEAVEQVRGQLNAIYSSDRSPEQKRKAKQQTLAGFRQRYLQQHPQGIYRHWLSEDLNNAKLASLRTYNQWVEHFLAKLESSDSLAEFYQHAAALKRMPPEERGRELGAWLGRDGNES